MFLGRSRHKDQSESGITGLNSAMMDKLQARGLRNPSSFDSQNTEVSARDEEERGR